MTVLHKLYHFLGSVYFAIILIASVALFVVAGTLIESLTDSHRYAAYFTYSNPFFVGLLWGFFINILISSLRRWPFQPRHIPFLITHLGLLMILSGALAKSSFGTQGSMGIMEGSGSDEIFIPDTYVVRVDKRDPKNPDVTLTAYYPLRRTFSGHFNTELTANAATPFDELRLNLAEYAPNSYERMESWMKGHWGIIRGLTPFLVHDWNDPASFKTLPVSTRVRFQPDQEQAWDIFAGRTSDVAALAKQAYVQNLEIELKDNFSNSLLYKGPLQHNISWDEGKATVDLDFSFSPVLGFDDPHLLITLTFKNRTPEIIRIPLQDPDSLKNINLLTSYLGRSPVTVDLHLKPALVFLQDLHGDLYLFAYDPFGRVHVEPFRNDNLQTLVAYDSGFGGYAVQAKIPFARSISRNQEEQMQLSTLKEQMGEGLKQSSALSPPLVLLRDACRRAGIDFPTCCLDFLVAWDKSSSWLYPVDQSLPATVTPAIEKLDWEKVSPREKKACYWTHLLFKELEPDLRQGKNLMQVLSEKKWPLLDQLKTLQPQSDFCSANMTSALLTMLTQQIFFVADQLPEPDKAGDENTLKARLLSAHLRAHGIHLSNITMPAPQQTEHFAIECPLTPSQHNDLPHKKLEDNLPKITLQVKAGEKSEWITLSYDRFGQGLKWPIMHGEYTLRFQPDFKQIPYRIRLRSARQINYANSMQPYSFESDLIITDINSKDVIEKTISMNNVHETWEGYRFYLSNISPGSEMTAKRIQLVVNWDPAKYWLTYPGAVVLTLGIGLLFWFRKKK